MTEIRCISCGKKLAEHLHGQLKVTCPRCHLVNMFERDLTECGILNTGKVGAKYRETGEQRNDTRLGSDPKITAEVKS